jgi:hypothetical protein
LSVCCFCFLFDTCFLFFLCFIPFTFFFFLSQNKPTHSFQHEGRGLNQGRDGSGGPCGSIEETQSRRGSAMRCDLCLLSLCVISAEVILSVCLSGRISPSAGWLKLTRVGRRKMTDYISCHPIGLIKSMWQRSRNCESKQRT